MAMPYSSSSSVRLNTNQLPHKAKTTSPALFLKHALFSQAHPPQKESLVKQLRVRAGSAPIARFIARRKETVSVRQLQRPLLVHMRLPASQYSVLDAERIERVDENTFMCFVYRFKFFAFEVCPVLHVRVEEDPYGCCIKLLSCKLEGSPIVAAQNEKFSASMTNRISCDDKDSVSVSSDAVIEVNIEVPFAFQLIPTQAMESMGNGVLDQIFRVMLPRFMAQLVRDYQAWASGDTSRRPLGTGRVKFDQESQPDDDDEGIEMHAHLSIHGEERVEICNLKEMSSNLESVPNINGLSHLHCKTRMQAYSLVGCRTCNKHLH